MIRLRHTTLLAATGLLLTLAAYAKQDILKPEQAFRYDVSSTANAIHVDWTIEPGHYLYKERMSYATTTPGVVLGEAELPPGKAYADEFFGDMHIYRGAARIRIPIVTQPADGGTLDLTIRSQGCADIGLCYPPQTWSSLVTLTAQASSSKLTRLLAGGSRPTKPGAPLPPEQAFSALVSVADPFTLRVDFTIAEGYYLYRDSIAVNATGDTAATGKPLLPPGTLQFDEHFGESAVFYSALTFEVPLTRSSPARSPTRAARRTVSAIHRS